MGDGGEDDDNVDDDYDGRNTRNTRTIMMIMVMVVMMVMRRRRRRRCLLGGWTPGASVRRRVAPACGGGGRRSGDLVRPARCADLVGPCDGRASSAGCKETEGCEQPKGEQAVSRCSGQLREKNARRLFGVVVHRPFPQGLICFLALGWAAA